MLRMTGIIQLLLFLSMAKHKHDPSFLVEYRYKFIMDKVIYATTVSSNSYQPNAPYKNII
jgi:hypothetical protein